MTNRLTNSATNEDVSLPLAITPPAPKALRVTSAREWRKLRQQGVLVELPSGMVARLRPVGLMDLFRAGKIPDALTGIVAELVSNGTFAPEKSEMTGELITVVADLYDIVCRAAFISPAIVPAPQEDHDEIELEDVSQADRQFVLAWASAPTNELRDFRQEAGSQSATVEPVGTGEGIRKKAE